MVKILRRIYYLLAFIMLFGMTCYLLTSPRLARLFHPLPYRAEIGAAAAAQGLDPFFIAAVIRTESSFRENAVSPEGARGLMQLLPSTAEWIAAQNGENDFHPDKLFEPRYNITAGTRYLADLLRQFEGNEVAALAAYNGGRGRVQRWLEEGLWDGSEATLARIPFGETRAFVKRVLKNYRSYRELYEEDLFVTAAAGCIGLWPIAAENSMRSCLQEENQCIKLL